MATSEAATPATPVRAAATPLRSPSPTLRSTAPHTNIASPLNLQGTRRIIHLDGTTQEGILAGSEFRGRRLLSAPVDGAHVTYGSPKLVSAYRTLPTEFVSQTESGYYKVAGELVDEKVYEGRKLQAELVDEKVYEGRHLVGELVDEKVTMGKAAIISVEEVAQVAPRVNVTVRELPAVVRSVKVLEPKYVQRPASEKVTVNTYVTVGEPVIYELPPVTVTEATPIFLGGKAYRRTDAGYSPVYNSVEHTARYGPHVVRGSPSVRSASPATSVGSPTFSSPYPVRSGVRVATPIANSVTSESP